MFIRARKSASTAFRAVTLNFLAGGGDGYPYPAFETANASLFNKIELEGAMPAGTATFADSGTEQDALAEFLADRCSTSCFVEPDTPPAQDTRILNRTFVPAQPIDLNGKILAQVWNDLNNNMMFDESGAMARVPGVSIILSEEQQDGSFLPILTQVTSEEGMVRFENLTPGNYRVSLSSATAAAVANVTEVMITVNAGDCQEANFPLIVNGPTSIELASFSGAGGTLAWETSFEKDTLGYNIIDAATGNAINERLILALGGGSYSIDAGPGTYILLEVTTDLNTVDQATITVYPEIDATPVEGETLVVDAADTSVTVPEGYANVLVTGITADTQVLDVTNPNAPVVLIGSTLETDAGTAQYVAAPTGTVLEF